MASVYDTYTAATGHAPDAEGLQYWQQKADAGEDISVSIPNAINAENSALWSSGQKTATAEPSASVTDILQPGLVPTSTSYSGIGAENSSNLLDSLLPQLTSSAADLSGQVDDWTESSLASSASASKNLLDGHLTSLMADLAKRGIGGTALEGAIADTASQVASDQTAADLAITSQGASQKFEIPTMLANIAGVGTESTSETTDPLAPYELYANMLSGMM